MASLATQSGAGGTMSRLGRARRTRVIPMEAPQRPARAQSAPIGATYVVPPSRRLTPPIPVEIEGMSAALGLIRTLLEEVERVVPEASTMLHASMEADGFIPLVSAYKRQYPEYDRVNALFRQRFRIPASNPAQLFDLYRYYKHADAFIRGTDYNLLNFTLYPYGTMHRPNYTSAFYQKYMDLYHSLNPREETIFNDIDNRVVYRLPGTATQATQATQATRSAPAELTPSIRFEYAVKKNETPGEKPDAPACFACDEEAHIEGEWLFTVSYPYKNNTTGRMETKTHYYDYENITKAPLLHQHRTRHPILMGNHFIDLDAIREKMTALQRGSRASRGSQASRVSQASSFSSSQETDSGTSPYVSTSYASSSSASSSGGGTVLSRLRAPSPTEMETMRAGKQALDDLIQGVLNLSIVPGLAAVFAEAERHPFLTTQAAFHRAYPAVRDTMEPQFHTALHLPATITLYRLYRLVMHAVYFLKTPPETPNYNLLNYSGRNDDDYSTELMVVVQPIRTAMLAYLDRVHQTHQALKKKRPHTAPAA